MRMLRRVGAYGSGGLAILGALLNDASAELVIRYRTLPPIVESQELQTWAESELQEEFELEAIPGADGDREEGYSLEKILEITMETHMTLPERSRVDWLVLKTSEGPKMMVSAGLLRRDWSLYLPGSGEVRFARDGEPLPLERLESLSIREIEVGSIAAQFPTAQLRRRSNPALLRGEKYFMQTCLACHGADGWPDEVSSKLGQLFEGWPGWAQHSIASSLLETTAPSKASEIQDSVDQFILEKQSEE